MWPFSRGRIHLATCYLDSAMHDSLRFSDSWWRAHKAHMKMRPLRSGSQRLCLPVSLTRDENR